MKVIQKVLDISNKQKPLDDNAVAKIKAAGLAVILKIGYTGYGSGDPTPDLAFANNYAKLKAAGVPVGCYYFTLAYNDAITNKEIAWLKAVLKDKTFEYPVYIDVENIYPKDPTPISNAWNNCPAARKSANVARICQALEAERYYVGIYASKNDFGPRLVESQLKAYDKWIAQYNIICTYKGSYHMWQYSSKEPANKYGIIHSENRVDISNAYLDFPSIIKKNGLNNYGVSRSKYTYKITLSESEKKDLENHMKSLGIEYEV